MLATVPYGMSVLPSASCTLSDPVPTAVLLAWRETFTPVMTASLGIARVPIFAAMGSCVCPAVNVMVAKDAPVVSMLGELLHRTCPPIGMLPAATGTCAGGVTMLPEIAVAYETSPITAVGLDHTLPVPVDTAEVGTLGPRNSPTVEIAVPVSSVYVPALKVTNATNVPAIGLTEMTYTTCPFNEKVLAVNPLRVKPSFTVGVGPE